MSFTENFVLGEIFDIRVGNTMVRTKLQEIVSDTEFVVLQPTINGMPIRSENNEFTFLFRRPNGCISFRARILYSYKDGDLALSRVLRVSEMERAQRRQFYRLPIVLDIVIDMGEKKGGRENDDEEQDEDSRFCKGKTVNLSENSVELTCYRHFERDTKLVAVIKLTESDAVLVNAKVLRCTRESRTDPYCVVLVFVDQSEKERRLLRRFIFKQQALMLSRR